MALPASARLLGSSSARNQQFRQCCLAAWKLSNTAISWRFFRSEHSSVHAASGLLSISEPSMDARVIAYLTWIPLLWNIFMEPSLPGECYCLVAERKPPLNSGDTKNGAEADILCQFPASARVTICRTADQNPELRRPAKG